MQALQSELEANNETGILRADEALLSARIEYREQLESFLLDMLSTAYNTDSAALNVQLEELRLIIAEENLEQDKNRYNMGQIAEHQLAESEAALRTAQLNLEAAQWDHEDRSADFLFLTGLSWTPLLLPVPDELDYPITDSENWLAIDSSIQRAKVRLQLQQLKLEQLPLNTAPYGYKLELKAKEQAERALERTESASIRRYEQLRRQLLHEKETIKLRKEEKRIHEGLVQKALAAYEEGLISRAALGQERIQLIQAELREKQSNSNYLSALISMLVHSQTEEESRAVQ